MRGAGGGRAYEFVRPVARRARATWNRLLHQGRRTRARRQVARLAPRSILFICHGNINRSAYAEARFRHVCPLEKPAGVGASELVVVMDGRQAQAIHARFGMPRERILVLGDLEPRIPARRLVQDPVERPREDDERIFDRIDRCVDELIRCLSR